MSKQTYPADPVLLVDDDSDLLRSYSFTLREAGVTNLVQQADSREVEGMLDEQAFELVLLDLNMPTVSGRELLPVIIQKQPDTPVIVITGVDEVETAVSCMRTGAFDYMVKPIGEDALAAIVQRAVEVREMRRENSLLRRQMLSAELSHPDAFRHIITQDPNMKALFHYIDAVAVTPQPILITGETGTGKELIAQAVHRASGREGPFVPVNIAGVDANAFSDTLFGHVKGAFTGAIEPRKGLIERAAGGTLFLDEIGDLDADFQVKLLRLVQEREYYPLGSDLPKKTDTRIVVATNCDLQERQKEGTFRDDLYYRLRSHLVHVPPLRERLGDVALLLEHFLEKAAGELGIKKPAAPRELLTLLKAYHFPGNVREMESLVYNAVSTHKSGILSMDTFRSVIGSPAPSRDPSPADMPALFEDLHPLPTIREAEDMLIEAAIRRTDGNQTMASELLGITRQTLIRHLKKSNAKS